MHHCFFMLFFFSSGKWGPSFLNGGGSKPFEKCWFFLHLCFYTMLLSAISPVQMSPFIMETSWKGQHLKSKKIQNAHNTLKTKSIFCFKILLSTSSFVSTLDCNLSLLQDRIIKTGSAGSLDASAELAKSDKPVISWPGLTVQSRFTREL